MSQVNTANTYVYGSTARKIAPVRPEWEVQSQLAANKRKRHAATLNVGYVLFLVLAIATAAFVLINYIQLQSELTGLSKTIVSMEKELNVLRDSNNDAYQRAVNSVDMEEIRRVAVEELGMVYAQEDQIVLYDAPNNDYMRQIAAVSH